MSTVPVLSRDPLRRAGRLVWPNLPVLLVGSVPAAFAWTLVRLLPPDLSWLAVLGVGLVVLPLLAPLLHGSAVLLDDEHFGLRGLGPALVHGYLPATRVTAPPTLAVLLTLLAEQLWRTSHQNWMLVSVGVGAGVSLVAACAGVVALPYILRPGAPTGEAWLVAGYVASHNPVPVLAVLSALGLGVGAAAHLSFALVLLLPAPLALVWAAAAGSLAASQARLPDLR